MASNLSDFKDAVQPACGIAKILDAIVTRDAQDFTSTSLQILSEGELLQHLSEGEENSGYCCIC